MKLWSAKGLVTMIDIKTKDAAMSLDIQIVPILSDNYVYLAKESETGKVMCVDPGEAAPVLAKAEELGWDIDTILITHHHGDHVAGVKTLKAATGATVIGPGGDSQDIPGLDQSVADGDKVDFGGETFRVIGVYGHTSGHITYFAEKDQALFSGDALFSVGCGRFFEGTAEDMWPGLLKLRDLPDATRVYCGHEYTASNVAFAASIDGQNAELQRYAGIVAMLRSEGMPTIPANLGLEKKINPFLRADDPSFAELHGFKGQEGVAFLAHIRAGKDSF